MNLFLVKILKNGFEFFVSRPTFYFSSFILTHGNFTFIDVIF
jgi:hypothetical protein